MGLGKSSINSYLPYTKASYKESEISANADRCDLYRKRKKAVEKINDFESFWLCIGLFSGYPFLTVDGNKYTYECIWGSLKRMLIGFAIAAFAGFIVGALAGNYTKLKYVFNPTMIAIKTVPTAALIFVFLVLAGLKNAPIYMVSIIVFPMIYEATASGFQHVDKELVLAATLDSKSPLQIMSKIKFPLSFPYIALGLITSFSLSFKIEIMSEVISGSSTKGIGNAIQQAYLNSSNGLIPTFAYAFIAIALMLLVALLLSFVKKPLKNLA